MQATPLNFRDSIRQWKNARIQDYLRYRIGHAAPYQIAFRKTPYRVLWVLSHMRSGSSLLTHILNTNPEIVGYGETHIRYQSPEDFKKLLLKVYWQGREYTQLQDFKKLFLNETYMLDKLLHNNKLVDVSLMSSNQIYAIFLLREPLRSLNSIRDLKPHWSENKTVHYYCDRLQQLVAYAEQMQSPARSLTIRYDQLLNDTPSVFEALQTLLQTQTGFTEKYEVLQTTGQKHTGDPKGNILSGQIIRTPRQLKETVSTASVDRAMTVYEDCTARLATLTTVMG